MTPRIVLFLLVVLFSTAASAGPKLIAVLEFNDFTGLSTQEVEYITDIVRRQALTLPSSGYSIMTRENITDMLPPGKELANARGWPSARWRSVGKWALTW